MQVIAYDVDEYRDRLKRLGLRPARSIFGLALVFKLALADAAYRKTMILIYILH